MKEDIVEIILNLKTLRFKFNSDEPVSLRLTAKGPKEVTAADFDTKADCEVVNKEVKIATLAKGGKLDFEIVVDKGLGYEPVEKRNEEKLPIGTIPIDSIFTPVKKVHYEIEKTRVGSVTDFDKLTLEVTTDGSIDPEVALEKASKILVEHFSLVAQSCESEVPVKETKEKKKAVKKTVKSAKKSK